MVLQNIRILLIDDNKDHFKRIASLLEVFEKYHLSQVGNSTRGLDALSKDTADVYIVFEKIGDRDGIDLIKKFQAGRNVRPIIFLTVSSDPVVIKRILESGASDYLIYNELSPEKLDHAIRYCLTEKVQQEQEQKEISQESNLHLLQLLNDAQTIIASSLQYQDTLPKLAELIVGQLADWCIIDVLEDKLVLAAYAHAITAKSDFIKKLRSEFSIDSQVFLSPKSVVKTQQMEIITDIEDTTLKSLAKSSKHYALLQGLGIRSVVILPLIARHEVVGALTLVKGDSGRVFTDTDFSLLKELALRIATGIDNYRLYQKSKYSESIFQRMVESDMMGIAIIDFDGRVLGVNDVALRMFGFSRSEVLSGFNWNQVYPKEGLPTLEGVKNDLLANGVSPARDMEIMHKDGHLISVLVGNLLLDKRNGTVLAFIVDITKQKELEKQKEEFISIASHELKTPLTSQRLFVGLLKRALEKERFDEVEKLVIRIEDQNNRLIHLVKDLLDISRIDAGRMLLTKKETDLDTEFNEIVVNYRMVTKRDIDIEGRISENVLCDPLRIEQVFNNLLSNAIKYSPDDSKIRIKVQKNSEQVIVSITDFGIGISDENKEQLFKRFYRTQGVNNTYPGFGLGLYISYEIISRHNGRIWVESKEGKGSTFYFSLPITATST